MGRQLVTKSFLVSPVTLLRVHTRGLVSLCFDLKTIPCLSDLARAILNISTPGYNARHDKHHEQQEAAKIFTKCTSNLLFPSFTYSLPPPVG